MSREILFKAKRIDNGEWGEGQYAYITNPLTEDGKPIRHLICNGTNIFNDLIDPVTLCQFTGLRDNTKWRDLTEAEKESFLSDWNYREDRKNKIEDWSGRKIWENDIVECNKRKEECGLYKVIWRKEYADFGVVPISNTCIGQYPIGFSYGKTLHGRDYKLVGNIFDNHELLEVEK